MQQSQPENPDEVILGPLGLRKASATAILPETANGREDGSVTLFCASKWRRRYAL